MERTVPPLRSLRRVLIVALKLAEYQFLVIEHSLEIYGGIVAALFATLGIWLGLKRTKITERVVVREVSVPVGGPFVPNTASIERLGLTPREIEILQLIAHGLSTGDRRVPVRQREHRQDALGQAVLQAEREAPDSGRARRGNPLNG